MKADVAAKTVGGFLGNALLSALALGAIYGAGRLAASFLIMDAVSPQGSIEACRTNSGACWPFIAAKFDQLMFGRYPDALRWRVILGLSLPPLSLSLAFLQRERLRLAGLIGAAMASLGACFCLVAGGLLGLTPVATDLWGGLTLTLLIAYTGFMTALPLGIVLALGRRSSWPVPRVLSIVMIEFWRGVPLVTVLFMASVMLPFFLPEGVSVNKLARALIAIAIFASAYVAEAVRGGLQSIHASQFMAGEALGLAHAQNMRYVVLPQALHNALPAIAGTLIGLLKDTTLVLVIGLFDFLGMVQLTTADPAFSAPTVAATGYLFAGLVFWGLCFGISRLSMKAEKRPR